MWAAVRSDSVIGQVVGGRYQVLRPIGKGGMGAVYEVRHLKLKRTFAMKTLSKDLTHDPEVQARFQREADVVASLRHPNIVDIVDWETMDDGAPCMIMEYLRGEDLSSRLQRGGPMSWPMIARIADQVLSGLAVAHRAGIIHRDLKPDNIFLAQDDAGEERAKLLDFGVSKIRGMDSKLTGHDRVIGTPAYMSPEQADGRTHETGPATDVWAMGAILYEMATAQIAFLAASVPSILYRICHTSPDPMRAFRPDAPPAFEELVMAALSRDRAGRITTIEELRTRLRGAMAPVVAGVYGEPPPRAVTAQPHSMTTPMPAAVSPAGGVAPAALPSLSHGMSMDTPTAVTPMPRMTPPAIGTTTPPPEMTPLPQFTGQQTPAPQFTGQQTPAPGYPPLGSGDSYDAYNDRPAPMYTPTAEVLPAPPVLPPNQGYTPRPSQLATPTTLTRATGHRVAARRGGRRPALMGIGIAILIVAAVGTAIGLKMRADGGRSSAPAASGVPDKPPVVPDEPAVVPDKPAVVPDKPPVAPDKPAVAPDKPPVVPDKPPVEAKGIEVKVESTPPATVFVDGKKAGRTPMTVTVPPGKKARLKVMADGYRPGELTLDGSETQVRMKLERKRTKADDGRPERIGPLPIGD